MALPIGAVPTPDDGRRADIEGLRAVAVVLVVLFHASIGGFSGGFVGVDVFFVLSGYLITGLLLREIDSTGTISLSAFYARRARRLLPAAVLVLLVTLVASILVLPPLLIPDIAADTAAAAAYVSNVRFALQATDYFAAGQAPSPILHYWSLGVEEQFYLLWPAVILLVARGSGRRTRRVGVAVTLIAIGSLFFAIWLTSAAQPWAFFSLPARAWELALGGMLAVAGTRVLRIPGSAAALAAWAGLILIVLAGVALDETTPFPGLAALAPAAGAALVIVGGTRPTSRGPGMLLGTAIPRFLGRISYALYLWHWPLLVLPAVAIGAPLPLSARAALVVIAVVLAAATHRWVEEPLRRGWAIGTRPRRNLAMAGALTLVVAGVSLGVDGAAAAGLRGSTPPGAATMDAERLDEILGNLGDRAGASTPGSGPAAASPAGQSPASSPAPDRAATPDGPVPADLRPALGDARADYPESYLDGCHAQTEMAPSTAPCTYGNLESTTTIALFGDSHALSWFPAVERLARDRGWQLLSLTMSACSPADMAVWNPDFHRVSTACARWRASAVARLVKERPEIILVTGTRGFQAVDASGRMLSGEARTQAWVAGMKRTLGRLTATAGRVILIADAPLSRVDPPVCLSQHPASLLACTTPVSGAIDDRWLRGERSLAAQAGVGFIDPTRWICPTSPCPVVLGNLLVYRDAGHLTATFAAALWHRLESAIAADFAARRSGMN
jgi:peptidoglycan/LPS O-acetylase OafA/YrhL